MAELHRRQHQPRGDGAHQLVQAQIGHRRVAEDLLRRHEVPAGGGGEGVRGQGQADQAGQGQVGGPFGKGKGDLCVEVCNITSHLVNT